MKSVRQETILPRAVSGLLEKSIAQSPVVVLTGARQTGKTTLIKSLPSLARHHYLTLDDFEVRARASQNPQGIIETGSHLILDEVQRSPDLLLAVKQAVDSERPRVPGRFVLTGSANLLLMHRVSESLAGRALYVTLRPLTRFERLGLGRTGAWGELMGASSKRWAEILRELGGTREALDKAVQLGGYPVPAHDLDTQEERDRWFAGYVQTYLERDLQELTAVENLADFRRLMTASALRTGGMLNLSELSRDTAIGQTQVGRFLNLMETSYQIIRLPSYSVNRTRRLIKAPKLYWGDTGLASYLSGESVSRGAHLENLILVDLMAWRDLQVRPTQILYWRTVTGFEVDFVIETGARLLPIEVKSSRRVGPDDTRGLRSFLSDYSDMSDGGLLLYDGDDIIPFGDGILAVPWWMVC